MQETLIVKTKADLERELEDLKTKIDQADQNYILSNTEEDLMNLQGLENKKRLIERELNSLQS